MRVLTLIATLLVLGLAAPASASAFYVAVEGGTVRYSADAGERNLISGLSGDREANRFTHSESVLVRVGPGCRKPDQRQPPLVVCDAAGVTAVDVALGDGDDILNIGNVDVPVTYSGGDGFDRVYYAPHGMPLVIGNDGVADDGPRQRDNVLPDVEALHGSTSADTLAAGPNGAELWLELSNDVARGGAGDDVIVAASGTARSTPAGFRRASFDPGGTDRVTCGDGRDIVEADRRDSVARDCEIVGRDGVRIAGRRGYQFTGSAGHDQIVLPPLPYYPALPTRIRALGGNDTLVGGDDMRGGRGNDRLVATDGYRTSLAGEAGKDRIDARDTRPHRRDNGDTVRCGSGRDVVYVDRADRVSRDCERVRR